jgi:hypothetical protein
VHFRESDGDTHTCTFREQADWDRYDVGTPVTLKMTITGKPDCDTLAPAS